MHVVYVLSPDFAPQLAVSLRSLFASPTDVDRVTVLSVGGPIRWDAGDLPIAFREVPDIGSEHWMMNKTHLCDLEGEELVFLDTDTLVLGDLGGVVQGVSADVGARRATATQLDSWDEAAWKDYLEEGDCSTTMPVLNAGLLVFRGGVHRRIKEDWTRFMLDARRRRLFGNGYHAAQWSLPVALGRQGAEATLFSKRDHAFAWEGDSHVGSTVYHTGASNFFSLARRLDTSFMEADLPIPRPLLFWRHLAARAKKKARALAGANEKVVQ